MRWCCQRTQWSVPATCVSLCVCVCWWFIVVCAEMIYALFVNLKSKRRQLAKHLQDIAHTPRCHRQAQKKGTTATAQVLTDVRCQRGVGLAGGVATKATVLAVCESRERGVGAEIILIESQRRIQRGPGNT